MPLSPVAARELLVQARRRSTYGIRLSASLIAGFLMLWVLVIAGAPIPTASQGKALFTILSTVAFIYCLFVGPLMTADCLSAEKRDGTLGLLLLTDLKGYDVVLGKLASSSIHAIYGLIAVLPMLSMALLFGGISGRQISEIVLVLGNTFFFSLSAGMFVSTISKHDRKAFFGAVLLVLMVSAVPYETGYLLALWKGNSGPSGFWEVMLLPSPFFAFTLTQSPMTGTGLASNLALSSSLAVTHAFSWFLLLLSCAIVPRLGKERPRGKRGERWSEWWRELTLGDRAQRGHLRERLLNLNPCLWLSNRERYKPALPWVLVLPLGILGVWIYVTYPTVFMESGLFLIFMLEVLLKVWFTAETCGRWIEDRRNGALELLLCAPLKTETILRGQELALRRQFGLPAAAIILFALLAGAGCVRLSGNYFSDQTWSLMLLSVPVFLADLVTLRWVGAWFGLTARGLNRAISAALIRVLFLRWIFFGLILGAQQGLFWIGQSQSQSNWQTVFWVVFALICDLILLRSAKRKFVNHFRILASSPSDFRSSSVAAIPEVAKSKTNSPKSRRFRIRPALVLPALMLTTFLSGYFGYRHWLENGIEIRLKAIHDAGFAVTREEQDRARPAVPKLQNAAVILEEAALVFVPTWRIRASNSLLQQIRAGGANLDPLLKDQDRVTLNMLISTNKAGLEILHSAPSLRIGRYEGAWSSPSYNSQIQAFTTATELLQAEVLLDVENADVSGALDSLRRLLDLARSLDNEAVGGMFSHLRIACLKRVFGSTQFLISRCAVPLPDLESLQKDFEDLEAHINLAAMLAGMRCSVTDAFRNPPIPPPLGRGGLPPLDQIRFQIYMRCRHLSGGADRDLIAFLDTMEQFIQLAPLPDPERLIQARQIAAKYPGAKQNRGPGLSLTAKLVLDSYILPQIELEARSRAMRLSLGIERFRIQHAGKLPENLAGLAPRFISAVPNDPFDGKPMRFQRVSRGYCVYSVGRNGRDDGGTGGTLNGRPADRTDDIAVIVE